MVATADQPDDEHRARGQAAEVIQPDEQPPATHSTTVRPETTTTLPDVRSHPAVLERRHPRLRAPHDGVRASGDVGVAVGPIGSCQSG